MRVPGDEGDTSFADQVSIETGRLEQLADVTALARACPEAPHWPPDAWRNLVQPSSCGGDRRSVLLVARAPGGELVGWLAASGIYETTELEFVLVHPGYRGRRVASRLMESWLRWAEGQGALKALLEVRPSNGAAIRLYGQFGFVERGRRRSYYKNPVEDAVLMWCQLRQARGTDVHGDEVSKVRQV